MLGGMRGQMRYSSGCLRDPERTADAGMAKPGVRWDVRRALWG